MNTEKGNIKYIIEKHERGKPLSIQDLEIIARKVFPLLNRSDEITVSHDFLKACADLLFASSKEEFQEKMKNLQRMIVKEIDNIPYERETANEIHREFSRNDKIKFGSVKPNDFISTIQLLVKLYNRYDKSIDCSLRVYPSDFYLILYPYPNNDIKYSFSFFGNKHECYHEIMRTHSFDLSPKCMICRNGVSFLTTFREYIKLVQNGHIYCRCWEKFASFNQERRIPCSEGGCDGSLCSFCDQYKEMQLMEFIGVINDLFKVGSLSNDVVYNDLFDTFCQIIIGGSSMPVMPLMMKLYKHLPSIDVRLFDKLLRLITKFEGFFRSIKSIPRPDFLSTPNLRDFTEANYQAYMAELNLGQYQFQTVIPKFGFCRCREIAKLNRIKEKLEEQRNIEKIAEKAVENYKKITI
jgi:hypothetical protein